MYIVNKIVVNESCLLYFLINVIDLFFSQNQLSGYLLRKFKNSNGWQKLWVVFTNFCLFFYKTFQVRFSKHEHCV
jgi:hypothetical protein